MFVPNVEVNDVVLYMNYVIPLEGKRERFVILVGGVRVKEYRSDV